MEEIKWRTGEPPKNGNYLVDTGDDYCMDYWFIHTWDDNGDKVKGWFPIEGDIEEVTRCKDCVYWGTKVIMKDETRGDCLNFFGYMTQPDFYCKWGEKRKDGGQNA